MTAEKKTRTYTQAEADDLVAEAVRAEREKFAAFLRDMPSLLGDTSKLRKIAEEVASARSKKP